MCCNTPHGVQLNARKAIDKIQEWQSAAGQMKGHLPQGDEVLAAWFRQLQEFKQDLPLLHKLSNDALKVSDHGVNIIDHVLAVNHSIPPV